MVFKVIINFICFRLRGVSFKTLLSLFLVLEILFFPFVQKPVLAVAPDNYQAVVRNSGIAGYSIIGLVVDPTDGNTVYILTQTSGVYKSTNGGSSWTAKNNGFPVLSPAWFHVISNALAIDPNNPSTLYTQMDGKIYKTTDGAENWVESSNGTTTYSYDGTTTDDLIAGVVVDPNDSNTLYAATIASGYHGGLFRSTNGGSSWTQIAGTSLEGWINIGGWANDAWPLAVDPSNSNKIYFSSIHETNYRTTNGGSWWDKMTFPSGYSYSGNFVTVHPTSGVVYIGNGGGMIRSTDSGANFTPVSTFSGKSVMALKFAPSNSDIGYASVSSGQLYKTTDGGDTWAIVNSSTGASISEIAIHPTNPDIIYFGSQTSGMFKSTNGGSSLTAINTGLPGSLEVRGIFQKNGVLYMYLKQRGVYRSLDHARSWEMIISGEGSYWGLFASNSRSRDVWVAMGTRIYRLQDDGSVISIVGEVPLEPGKTILEFVLDPKDEKNMLVYNAGQVKIFRSTNGGIDWTPVITDAFNSSYNGSISDLAYDPINSNIVYASGLGDFYKSTDGGLTWASSSSGMPNGTWIAFMWINNLGHLYASSYTKHIYKSVDGANSWSDIGQTPDGNMLYSLSFDKDNPLILYALSGYGSCNIYRSENGGQSWQLVVPFSRLPSGFVAGIVVAIDFSNSGRIYIGSATAGMVAYENRIPIFEKSTFTARNVSGDTSFHPGDTVEFVFTLKNSGWEKASGTNVKFILPDSGMTFKPGSVKVAGASISPDPIEGRVLDIPVDDSLLENTSMEITFQAVIDNNFLGSILVDPLVTSYEDTEGTRIPDLYITVSPRSPSPGGACNKPSDFSRCVTIGSNSSDTTALVRGSGDNKEALLFLQNNVHHFDLSVEFEEKNIDYLKQNLPKRPFPWIQGLNIASKPFEVSLYSSFNGYPVFETDNPFIIQIPYDENVAKRISPKRFKLSYFDKDRKRWVVVSRNNVVLKERKVVANTIKKAGVYILVY